MYTKNFHRKNERSVSCTIADAASIGAARYAAIYEVDVGVLGGAASRISNISKSRLILQRQTEERHVSYVKQGSQASLNSVDEVAWLQPRRNANPASGPALICQATTTA